MQRMHKFLRLPSPDRRLLVQSAFLLGAIRLGLWLLPLGTLRRFLARMTPGTHQAPMDSVTWAVAVASRYVPLVTCFNQALATQVLLRRCGHPARLRIGVARSERGPLQAHAWVESEGRIVFGGPENLSRYTPLPPLEGERP